MSMLGFYAAVGATSYLIYNVLEANRKQNVALNEAGRTGHNVVQVQDYTKNVHLTRSEQQRVADIKPEAKVSPGYAIKWCITNMDGSCSYVHMTPQKINQKFKIVNATVKN